jgi:hypothetical protein
MSSHPKGTHVRQFLLAAASFAALIPLASASSPPARAGGISNPKLLDYQEAWGAGEEYAYEALKRIGVVE